MRTDYGYEFPGRDDVRDTVKNTLSSAVSSVGPWGTFKPKTAQAVSHGTYGSVHFPAECCKTGMCAS